MSAQQLRSQRIVRESIVIRENSYDYGERKTKKVYKKHGYYDQQEEIQWMIYSQMIQFLGFLQHSSILIPNRTAITMNPSFLVLFLFVDLMSYIAVFITDQQQCTTTVLVFKAHRMTE